MLWLQEACHAAAHDSLAALNVTLKLACCDAQHRTGKPLNTLMFTSLFYIPSWQRVQKMLAGGQVGKAFMKQQGFHIAEHSSHTTRPDDALQGSSQTSSKLAEGLQGLMDMCNAGSLMAASSPAMVGSCHYCSFVKGYKTRSPSSRPNSSTCEWSVPTTVAL